MLAPSSEPQSSSPCVGPLGRSLLLWPLRAHCPDWLHRHTARWRCVRAGWLRLPECRRHRGSAALRPLCFGARERFIVAPVARNDGRRTQREMAPHSYWHERTGSSAACGGYSSQWGVLQLWVFGGLLADAARSNSLHVLDLAKVPPLRTLLDDVPGHGWWCCRASPNPSGGAAG